MDRENSVHWCWEAVSDNVFVCLFFSHQRVFHRGPNGPPSRSNWTWGGGGGGGQVASRGRGCVPEFLKKPIATCYFPGGAPPPSPIGSAHGFLYVFLL